MPPRCPNRCQRSIHTSSSYIWISDRQLAFAYDQFARATQRRHGSNVPGPMEAQRRAARRKMTGVVAVPAGSFDLDGLFLSRPMRDGGSYAGNLRSGRWDDDLQNGRLAEQEWRTEPGPIFQALFGPKQAAVEEQEIETAEILQNDGSEASRLWREQAPLDDILHYLAETDLDCAFDMDYLEFLTKSEALDISKTQYVEYIMCLRRALALGIVQMTELHDVLDIIKSWLQKKWADQQERDRLLAAFLEAAFDGAGSCHVQQLDNLALYKMRTLLDEIQSVAGMAALRFSVYRKSWPADLGVDLPLEEQLVDWLHRVRYSSCRPEPWADPFALTARHVQDAVDHLCDVEYGHIQSVTTDAQYFAKRSNVLTNVTSRFCQPARAFLDRERALDQFENTDSVDLRDMWLRLILQGQHLRSATEVMPIAYDNASQKAYECPALCYDVLEIVTRHLPLHIVLPLFPELKAVQYCRLLLFFSLGPTPAGTRIAMAESMGKVLFARQVKDVARLFEEEVADIKDRQDAEASHAVFSSYIKCQEACFKSEKVGFLASQRTTRLIYLLYGHDAALSFLASPAFRQNLSTDASLGQVEPFIRLAAEAFETVEEGGWDPNYAQHAWVYLKDMILQIGPAWYKSSSQEEPMHVVYHLNRRRGLSRLITSLASIAARDETITDRASSTIVHWLYRCSQKLGLRTNPELMQAFVISGMTRPLSNHRVPPDDRIKYLLHSLRNFGADADTVSQIDQLIVEWRNAVREMSPRQGRSAHPEEAVPIDGFNHNGPFKDSESALANAHAAGRADAALQKVSPRRQKLQRRNALPIAVADQRIRFVEMGDSEGQVRVYTPSPSRFAQAANQQLKAAKATSSLGSSEAPLAWLQA